MKSKLCINGLDCINGGLLGINGAVSSGLIPVSADTKSVIWCGRYQTIDWLTNLGN